MNKRRKKKDIKKISPAIYRLEKELKEVSSASRYQYFTDINNMEFPKTKKEKKLYDKLGVEVSKTINIKCKTATSMRVWKNI